MHLHRIGHGLNFQNVNWMPNVSDFLYPMKLVFRVVPYETLSNVIVSFQCLSQFIFILLIASTHE